MATMDDKWPVNGAIRSRSLANLRFRLDRGGDVNEVDWEGSPALFRAMRHDTLLARELLKRGADVTLTNALGQTALLAALVYGDFDSARRIAQLDPSQINRRDARGQTPAMQLAAIGLGPAIIALSSLGADFTLRDDRGATAMDIAYEELLDESVLAVRHGLAEQFAREHPIGRLLPARFAKALSKLRNTPVFFFGS